ncbi:uracil-DNA glycosylase [Candidatus Phycosocius spiralis]|uniref:Type-5 uracil-DNA glycosylase n=1 Tax=Candidatus Phycosocius spiralis TaxID=2815099 RepID=A0ABQ4PSZ4_9PROT|nr:uracil-DNA glycosylase [Candidatus Phycosocius spiralis]GIU65853.1 uracil-DNA glycosylase [Candidatus Phycosocius spiralis]
MELISPKRDCALCPRLTAYRARNQAENPHWFNGPAPAFGDRLAWLLIVGLAPGRGGANRTGRPFTGDWAGDLLYQTLAKFKLSTGTYDPNGADDLKLHGVMITNAVQCAPPENKPIPSEIANCAPFLKRQIQALPNLKHIICLGQISHESTVKQLGGQLARHRFKHGARHQLGSLCLHDSYHCSRYNTNTGRLTVAMFEGVFTRLVEQEAS